MIEQAVSLVFCCASNVKSSPIGSCVSCLFLSYGSIQEARESSVGRHLLKEVGPLGMVL